MAKDIPIPTSISELLNEKGLDPKKYCFDLFGLGKEVPKESKKIHSIATACMAVQKGVKYSTDAGPVQRSMFKALFDVEEENHCLAKDKKGMPIKDENESPEFACDWCLYSADRMTNFAYVVRMLLKILEEKDSSNISELASFACGGNTTPSYTVFYSKGYSALKKELDDSSKELEDLREQLNKFAKYSSTLGNYGCIPNKLLSLGVMGLNNLKGGRYSSLVIVDKLRYEYRINDQFALFVVWMDKYARKVSKRDQNIIDEWKRAMCLNEVWETYRKAAEEYRMVFTQNAHKDRIRSFVSYLELVNDAITERSGAIRNKLLGIA